LVSDEFLHLCQQRTGLNNPSFLDMKEPFWMKDDPIGAAMICPRDGKPGCALVDTLRPEHRGTCTHFLSWVWGYDLCLVREALLLWIQQDGLDPMNTFLYMCFFVNNQFRLLVEEVGTGSDNLDEVFEANLRRIGKVVAVLDHWKEPRYLSRVWCIFEQYTAVKLNIPVTMILAREPANQLLAEINCGEKGIMEIRSSLSKVDAEKAEATVKADEVKVKRDIVKNCGFQTVNKCVKKSMVLWVGRVVQHHMAHLVEGSDDDDDMKHDKRHCLEHRRVRGLSAVIDNAAGIPPNGGKDQGRHDSDAE